MTSGNESSHSVLQWCQEESKRLTIAIDALKKREVNLTFSRLFSAIATVVFLVIGFQSNFLFLIVSALSIIIFVKSVAKHLKTRDIKFTLQNTKEAIALSIRSMEDERFIPNKNEWVENPIPVKEKHWRLSAQEADDIDLYSEGASIFGKINRCHTNKGRQYLSGYLECPLMDIKDISERQAAFHYLEQKPELLHKLIGNTKPFAQTEDQFKALQNALENPSNISKTHWPLTAKITLFLSASLFIVCAIGILPFQLISISVLTNIIVAKIIEHKTFHATKHWLQISSLFEYIELFIKECSAIEHDKAPLANLSRESKKILTEGNLSKLKKNVSMIRLRYAGIIHMVVDTMFFWDIHWLVKLEKSLNNKEAIQEVENTIGHWEAILSLVIYNLINESSNFSELTNEKILSIKQGKHPLLPQNKVIPNDIHLHEKDRAWAISGSNMSGKSTFLRMVGLCTLFTQTGLKTPAVSSRMCPVRLMTDLRIRDNLFQNESYFLAEVRQLKKMIDQASGQPPLLGIIDEPYRGTNSDERVAASVEVLRCLLKSGGFFLTATHDREVTEMAEEMQDVSNHHFKEELSESDIAFDYTIRAGIAKTRNAIKVLEQEGYPKEVIERAEAILKLKNQDIRQF